MFSVVYHTVLSVDQFYLICINDSVNVSEKFKHVLFADDCILVRKKENNKKYFKYTLKWLCLNKLSINVSKNNFIVFNKSKRKIIPNGSINSRNIYLFHINLYSFSSETMGFHLILQLLLDKYIIK